MIEEAAAGDVDAVARRSAVLSGLQIIDISPLAEELAEHILRHARLPARARADALHIAIAASQGLNYLMTWNATHIANALIRPRVERACLMKGFEPPVLCTPDELIEGDEQDA